ncbi:MAG: c-type cytochrome [Steroidobacterales bacterium]
MMTLNSRWFAAAPAVVACVIAMAGAPAGPASAEEPAPARQFNANVDVPEFGSISSETDGKVLYETICQGCHMPDARGAKGAGAYPALAANAKLGSPAYPEYIVVHGKGGMPNFGRWLSDQQIAAVVNYVITHFGNASSALATADEVKAAR